MAAAGPETRQDASGAGEWEVKGPENSSRPARRAFEECRFANHRDARANVAENRRNVPIRYRFGTCLDQNNAQSRDFRRFLCRRESQGARQNPLRDDSFSDFCPRPAIGYCNAITSSFDGMVVPAVVLSAQGGQGGRSKGGTPAPAMTLTIAGFPDGGQIPVTFSQAAPGVAPGEGTSPAMSWSHAPEGTQSFFLHMHDMDVARNRTSDDQAHWVFGSGSV